MKKNVEHKLERIDREMRDWLDKRDFQWYYNTKWDGSDWDLYRKADSKYLIGITKQYRRVGGEYNLVISSE